MASSGRASSVPGAPSAVALTNRIVAIISRFDESYLPF
jgi:hypothetical protein